MKIYILREVKLLEFTLKPGGKYFNQEKIVLPGEYEGEERSNPVIRSAVSWIFIKDTNIGAGLGFWKKLESQKDVKFFSRIDIIRNFFKNWFKKCATHL